jgi:hypothetical protein
MKHGHKEKGKAAKAKHSGKKSSAQAGTKSKASHSAKAKTGGAKTTIQTSSPTSSKTNGKGRGRSPADGPPFSNPIVAAAFKRAVKKYPNAFRRLTD